MGAKSLRRRVIAARSHCGARRVAANRFRSWSQTVIFAPPQQEAQEVFGLRLTQQRDEPALSATLLDEVRCYAPGGTTPTSASCGMRSIGSLSPPLGSREPVMREIAR